MNANKEIYNHPNSKYLLALHSSTDTLGVAVLDLLDPFHTKKSATFPIGRKLSNTIITCVDQVLKKTLWKKINRLAVATGPGGFTGTRLTVAMTRIIAQQLNCSLDSFSSFELMAPRLINKLEKKQKEYPFWITKTLKRRGIIAGQYKINKNQEDLSFNEIIELQAPHLILESKKLSPAINATDNVESDVIKLLELSYSQQLNGKKNNWEKVLPIYPTSPVESL